MLDRLLSYVDMLVEHCYLVANLKLLVSYRRWLLGTGDKLMHLVQRVLILFPLDCLDVMMPNCILTKHDSLVTIV